MELTAEDRQRIEQEARKIASEILGIPPKQILSDDTIITGAVKCAEYATLFERERQALPPDNETVEDGGGCYVAGSRETDQQVFERLQEWYHTLSKRETKKMTMWKIEIGNGSMPYIIVNSPHSSNWIATVKNETDAELIARAPELLEENERLKEANLIAAGIAQDKIDKLDSRVKELEELLKDIDDFFGGEQLYREHSKTYNLIQRIKAALNL